MATNQNKTKHCDNEKSDTIVSFGFYLKLTLGGSRGERPDFFQLPHTLPCVIEIFIEITDKPIFISYIGVGQIRISFALFDCYLLNHHLCINNENSPANNFLKWRSANWLHY